MSIHPTGIFEAEILEHGIVYSKNNTPNVAVKFATEHGMISGWFSLSDKAVEYTIEKLQNMGFVGTSFAELNSECLVRNMCSITVVHEEYDGKQRAKISFVNPAGYQGMEIKKDEAAARTASRFDALLRKANGGKSPQAPRPVPLAPVSNRDETERPIDDEVPF